MAEAAVSSSAPPSAPAPAPAAVGVPAVVYPKATVQDFLERYEVGETVGVGGEVPGSAAACTAVDGVVAHVEQRVCHPAWGWGGASHV
jgi:hypothetical protein